MRSRGEALIDDACTVTSPTMKHTSEKKGSIFYIYICIFISSNNEFGETYIWEIRIPILPNYLCRTSQALKELRYIYKVNVCPENCFAFLNCFVSDPDRPTRHMSNRKKNSVAVPAWLVYPSLAQEIIRCIQPKQIYSEHPPNCGIDVAD